MISPSHGIVIIRVFQGGNLLQVKQFQAGQIVVGSQKDLQLQIQSPQVSLIHCVFEDRDGSWFVADLGSKSGTRLNGQNILDTPVQTGDRISIGDFELEFTLGTPKPITRGEGQAGHAIPVIPSGPPLVGQSLRGNPVFNFVPPTSATQLGVIPLKEKKGGPQVSPTQEKSKKKTRKTFAPRSKHTSIKDIVKPLKGSIVEVLVTWREQILSTHHFQKKGLYSIGSRPENDIPVPIMAGRLKRAPLVEISSAGVTVFILPESSGELVRGQSSQTFAELVASNRITRSEKGALIRLDQGELLIIDVGGGNSVCVRFVGETPQPLMAPFFDLTTSELTGIVLSVALVAVLSLYMFLYAPKKIDLADSGLNEPLRTAMVVITPPKPPPAAPSKDEPVIEPVKPPPPPQKTKVVLRPEEKKQEAKPKLTQAVSVSAKKDPGVAANPVPNRNRTGPRAQTSVKQGGAVKTTQAKASQMQSRSKDATKAGIFSTLGGGGAQNALAGSTTGAGELAGLSAVATGRSGLNEDRPGEGLGSAVKDTGRGGSGKALDGIAGGISTQGRGGGNSGYGTGGLGGKVGVKVVPGGDGESFSGTIDKEAIRRVIMNNLRAIKACYERELNKTPDLVGKVDIEFDIGEKGIVLRAASRNNELGSTAVASCLVSRLKTWRFPEPPTNQVVTVVYPFVFSN